MDIQLFKDMLSMDSTSSREGALALMLAERLKTEHNKVELMPVGEDTYNLMLTWDEPVVMMCTHLDTVPPYMAPVFEGDRVRGRGTCDAKGQIMALYGACLELERRGCKDFGLLLLASEETGSVGARWFSRTQKGCEWLIVGEPTDCMMASAAKGTKSFHLTFTGRACHSGYPQNGRSAIDGFLDFAEALRNHTFDNDTLLGETTWNIGNLMSGNPKNILSDRLQCDIYFRTTFVSDGIVEECLRNIIVNDRMLGDSVELQAFGGDCPGYFETFDDMASGPVAFGSDAPHLKDFRHKILCGPGSILVAHTPQEYVLLSEIERATELYVRMYDKIKNTL